MDSGSSRKKLKGREGKAIDVIISSKEGSSHGPVFGKSLISKSFRKQF